MNTELEEGANKRAALHIIGNIVTESFKREIEIELRTIYFDGPRVDICRRGGGCELFFYLESGKIEFGLSEIDYSVDYGGRPVYRTYEVASETLARYIDKMFANSDSAKLD